MTSFKLLWNPGPAHYRLKVFAGVDEEHRVLAGELTLRPDEAAVLHSLIYAGWAALGICNLEETGWRQPATEATR